MQLYYNGFIPFCVYTTYFTLPIFFFILKLIVLLTKQRIQGNHFLD
ncbi:protein of unknown function [Streptococcus thermophilus]|nr:protein of unknown function [Streptococcus thermophilus]CAD0151541.1 protein of unknown function [Streptococcus thermophilus]